MIERKETGMMIDKLMKGSDSEKDKLLWRWTVAEPKAFITGANVQLKAKCRTMSKKALAKSVEKRIHEDLNPYDHETGATVCTASAFLFVDNKVCYECWHMSHPRDCSNIVECGSNQVCFVERYVTSDAHVYYNSGCLSNQSCHSHYPILGRRESENTAITKPDVTDLKRYNPSQYPDCSSCCQSDYCNTNLCETHQVNSTKKRCLSCDSVEHPSECHKVIGCDVDEMCYTTYYLHTFGEKRYRLGCMRKHVCDQSGMTNPVETHYCSECCTGDNCNRDLCK
ncbi:uncharacterized protein LOC132544424, partial [Ylistrum balloti]|uniref:uncharacterized protein LOC132544424 n=1 Tax=Ylistrum balloti TaxID=509963 RepID=UPI0029057E90